MLRLTAVFLGLVYVLNCSSGQQHQVNTVIKKNKVVKIRAVELNDKVQRKKYDLKVMIENLSDNSIVFFLPEVKCYKGKQRGQISHAFFGIGERSIDLKLGQQKDFRFVCVFPQPVAQGDFKIEISRIFDNPSNDGKTTGRVLAKDMVLLVKNPGAKG